MIPFLFEGESDVLTAMQLLPEVQHLGITGASTIPAADLAHAYLSHRKIGIIYDSDHAGKTRSAALAEHLLDTLSNSEVCNLTGSSATGIPAGSDLNEAMLELGEDKIRTHLITCYNAIVGTDGKRLTHKK